MEVYVDDEAKLTLHGLQQHYCKVKENEKNRKLFELLDVLEFNQVRKTCSWWTGEGVGGKGEVFVMEGGGRFLTIKGCAESDTGLFEDGSVSWALISFFCLILNMTAL